jgi:hypothetical protein
LETSGIETGLRCRAAGDSRRDPRARWPERREVPAESHVYLAWWEAGAFRVEPAWLETISNSGAAVDVEVDPGPGTAPWLCVIGPERTAWVSARLAGRRGRVVHLEFSERFPYDEFSTGNPGHSPRGRVP